MTVVTTSRMQEPATTTLKPKGYGGFYADPFGLLDDLKDLSDPETQAWTGKRKAAPAPEALDTTDLDFKDDVDWTKYSPPTALKTAPNITNEILLEVIRSSVEKIKTQIAEDNGRRLLEEEEKQRAAAEEAAKDAEAKGKELYLPIIMVQEKSEPKPLDLDELDEIQSPSQGSSKGPAGRGLIVFPIQAKRRRRFALTRLLQRITEHSDNMASGSTKKPSGQVASVASSNSNAGKESISVFRKLHRPKTPDTSELVECVSCLDDFAPKDVIKAPCHSYCHDCFERLIATAVQNEQQWPPKCCLNEIPFRTILRYASTDLKKSFQEKSQEFRIPISERIYCGTPDCSLWVKPDQVNAALRIARCSRGHWSCTICRGPQHTGDDCPQDKDVALTNELAEDEGWKRCSGCNALVEHREACQHMTCRCGNEFCYVCGLRWRTCSCTVDQLAAIKTAAATRRQQRIERQAEEEHELQEALRQIEEFEREETLKAELLRQEQERLEEEQRQRELEERIRQESLRRREIELKYQELREMLDQVHDLQQVLLEDQHEKDEEYLVSETKAMQDALRQKQETEAAYLETSTTEKIAQNEAIFETDYTFRVCEEKKVEEEYLQQLQGFWEGKKNGEERVQEAMTKFRKKMDRGWRAWNERKEEDLEIIRMQIEEERAIKEEAMYSIKQRLDESCDEEAAEMKRRKAAEGMWLQLVMAERERLLAEMEIEELDDGDVESWFSFNEDEVSPNIEHDDEQLI